MTELIAHVCHERAYPYSQTYGQAHNKGVVSIVLVEEKLHGLIESIYIAIGTFLGTFTLVVQHTRGQIIILIPPFKYTIR